MVVHSHRFGDLEVSDDRIYRIIGGLQGFAGRERYAALQFPRQRPFVWLQSVDDPDLAFVVVDPGEFVPDYAPAVRPEDLAQLGLGSVGEARLWVCVVIPPDPWEMTANLQGPLVVNPRTRLGKQVVLGEGPYTTKHSVIGEFRRAAEARLARRAERPQAASPLRTHGAGAGG